MNHDSLVLTVKMVRGNECSKAKKLCDSHSRLGEAVLAHLLTFVIRARQRLLELDDCLAPPAPPRRRRHAGGATWVDVRCGCERLRHDLKNPSTTVHAESSQHSALLFDQRPRSARAAGRQVVPTCRKVPHVPRQPPPPFIQLPTLSTTYTGTAALAAPGGHRDTGRSIDTTSISY